MREVRLTFCRHTVYYYWHLVSRGEWRLDDDPLESARRYIKEKGKMMHVALLEVAPEPGTRVLDQQPRAGRGGRPGQRVVPLARGSGAQRDGGHPPTLPRACCVPPGGRTQPATTGRCTTR